MNKKGQGVFFAVILGLGMIIVFFLALPMLLDFISEGMAGTDNAFALLIMAIIPIFMFMMIIWAILAMARNG